MTRKKRYQSHHFDGLRHFNPNVPQAPPHHQGQASRRGVSWWVWNWILNDDLNILIDPIWSDRCSPVSWAGPKQHLKPGIRFEDLPLIDVVLVPTIIMITLIFLPWSVFNEHPCDNMKELRSG
jgi:hypothetical protein